jgi:predicted anti-sigma-YlaC factor YlaD
MSENPCGQEARVLDAWRADRVDEAVRSHLATCESCREALEAAAFMRTVAAEPLDADHRIPEAARIWWRAQLVRRWEAERRTSHKLDRIYPFQAGVLAAAVILGVLASRPVVERWVAQTELGEATLLAASLIPAGMATSLIGGGILLALIMVVMARDMLAE